jgi:hypothetical protein
MGANQFRFEQFADGPSAQNAFEAAFPSGSLAEPALQALVDMGAQCKSAGPGKVTCRYVEPGGALAGWAWHVAVEANADKVVRRVGVSLVMLGV